MKTITFFAPLFLILLLQIAAFAADPEPDSILEQLGGKAPKSISGNPAAVNALPGTGLAGELLHLPEKSGLRLGGVWLADTNGLISGGAQPGEWSWNSALIVGANLDAEKLIGWQGASFDVQFLQYNGEDTNGQAGSVQGYNSIQGPYPLNRSELYQLWFRQALFEDRLIFRIGKQAPSMDFNNVARPVATEDKELAIPSVTGLLFTPIFVQPNLLGAIGGYYNSVYGFSVSVAPTDNTYLRYGMYDGNIARGKQTGLTGPEFNGYWYHIAEAGVDWVINDRYPGNFAAGLWRQTGMLQGLGVSENGAGGFYLFGSQRIWSNEAKKAPIQGDGKSVVDKNKPAASPEPQHSSISMYAQYGVNNSDTLPMDQSFGLGFTGFGLVPHRPSDSIGVGMSMAWLNQNIFARSNEVMLQGYYQAHIIGGSFIQPAISYIPNPGNSPNFDSAWAVSFRFVQLF